MTAVTHTPQKPDPLALRVAGYLHDAEQPQATILFGSRARGNHRPDSDIDLLVVAPQEVSNSLEHAVRDLASQLYQRRIPVDINHTTMERLENNKEFINSLATQAMLHGVVLSGRPDDFTSPYASSNPPSPKYDWAHQAYISQAARMELDIMLAFADLKPRQNTTGQIALASARQDISEEERRRIVAFRAGQAIRQALQSAAYATGAIPHRKETSSSLLNVLREAASHKELNTRFNIEDYQRETLPADMPLAEIAATVQQDTNQLLKLANRLKRRTDRRAATG